MVDIEHRALRALEEHRFAVVERFIEKIRGVRHEASNVRGEFEIFFGEAGYFERMAVRRAADRIFFGDHALKFLAEAIGLEQVAHTNAAACHFVFVSGADAARSGADFGCAARRFGGFVHFAMIGKNQVCAIAEEEASADFDAGLLEIFEFGYEGCRIDDCTGADDGFLFWAQDAARDELQHIAMAIEDDCVPRVMSPRVARGVIERRSEIVDDLAFAFVAPLGADDCDRFGPNLLRHFPHPATTRIASALLSLLHVKHYRRAFAATTETSSYAVRMPKARASGGVALPCGVERRISAPLGADGGSVAGASAGCLPQRST